ncbi:MULTISPECIES: rhomboid family intramembrane serine protease [Aeromicrobium]|uniref:Rhomboid family intramembrane serine protease n=1 Tax=Aeromicrobium yanjiei TaxID=2662028 RepID=A0A5Q2MI52_9ACTN|nr:MULTISPECIES: rhomboid family intramembrane serine protease [Aeromicrobium]MRK01795.1 rhomboid family intramembrane serine protease [Aeromicrobium sp. S22]QGG41459.1 rhomboid family intramembrane serine protease [Aeromicrobium yanjiei]
MNRTRDRRLSLGVAATAGMLVGAYVVLLYAVEIIDVATSERLERNGVHPRSLEGLDGIVFAPLLHDDWAHLIGNTAPLLVLGFLIGLSGVRTWLQVTAIVWVVGGVGVWFLGDSGTNHVGASGVVFGWLTYLIVRGVFNRSLGQIVVGLGVLVIYGSVLWGVLPGRPGVSWEGHLCGAAGGALAAWLLAERSTRRTG